MSGPPGSRVVADLGNSRLKWGRVDARGVVDGVLSFAVDDTSAWEDAWGRLGVEPSASWAISSVNPPAAERLAAFLKGRGVDRPTWYRSAAEVPVAHRLENPETAGADRALAVMGALHARGGVGSGLVVLCGTAVTVERVDADGTWQGGAIAAGMGVTARALHLLTAQIPHIAPRDAPRPWGDNTRSAVEAGVYWGTVGAVRELLTRQSEGMSPNPWVVWTGGDAPGLARAVGWEGAEVVPDLVLRGLAGLA